MNAKNFDELLIQRINKIQKTLASKALEYAREDRLHNFKRAADLQHITKEQACIGFLTKHLVSIMDLVADKAQGRDITQAQVDEKVGDAVCYLILLEALFVEDMESS